MISVFRRLRLTLPAKADVLIFDAAGSWVLSRFILNGIPHGVLPARFESIYVTPKVLMRMAANIRRLRIDDMPRGWFLNPRMLVFQLRHLYFLACLDLIGSKVVLTFVDTHIYFQRCSRTYPEATFIAVQNGARDRAAVTPPCIPAPPHPASRISIPHFHCFGRYEADLYAATGHAVDNFYPAGSVRGSAYLARRGPLPPRVIHDICIVSQWRLDLFHPEWRPEMARMPYISQRNSFGKVVEFVARYARERAVSVCVARASEHPEEETYFRQRLGDGADIVASHRGDLSSYACVDAAEVVVAGYSTLGIEALGWGKKALLCNFTGDDGCALPSQGLWSLSEPDYGAFRDRLDAIRAMTDAAYQRVAGEFARYMMQFDFARPAHLAIREHVLACLDGQGESWRPGSSQNDHRPTGRVRAAG